MSNKVIEGFSRFYKSDVEDRLDELAQSGVDDIMDQVLQKGSRPPSSHHLTSENPSDVDPLDTPIEEEEEEEKQPLVASETDLE